MAMTVQVNERGGLTLPKKLRRVLGIEKGGVVMIEAAEKGLLLVPAVAYPIELYSDERIREFDKEERALRPRMRGTGRA